MFPYVFEFLVEDNNKKLIYLQSSIKKLSSNEKD